MKKMTWLFGALGFLLAGYYATWQANLLSRGFELHQIATLIAAAATLSLMIDVPMGFLADRIGHKRTVTLGIGVYIAGFFVPGLSSSASAVVAAVVTIAVGDALLNGALESWTADLQRSEFGSITNRQFMGLDQAQRLGMILGAVAIPGIASLIGSPIRGAWFLYALAGSGVLAFALSLPAGVPVATPKKEGGFALFELLAHFKSPVVLVLSLGAFLFGMADSTNQFAFWPRIKELGISEPFFLGLIQSGMSLSRLGGLHVWKATGKTERTWIPSVALIASSMFFALFAFFSNPAFALVSWFLRIAVLSAYFSAMNGLIQRMFHESKWRATVASGIGTIGQIGGIGLSAAVGLWGSKLVPVDVCLLGAGLTLVAGFVMYLASSNRWSRDGKGV